MESVAKDTLLDADGRPLDPRIQAVLRELVPRFRHRFLTLRDELLVTEIFEEAGRLIAENAATFNAAKNPSAYAFRILCTSALLRLRHPSSRLDRATIGSDEGQFLIESSPARDGTPQQIEASIREAVPGAPTAPIRYVSHLPPDSLLEGRCSGRGVYFLKTYQGTSFGGYKVGDQLLGIRKDGHAVHYEGQLSPDGRVIEGRWSIDADPEHGTRRSEGHFTLCREEGTAE